MARISIITVNYNNATGLEKTIESVISQTFTDLEYIIIDGGSADGSVDVIERYREKLAFWSSEKDLGVYNAMNKGISRSSGEFLLFLNSGDFLSDKNVLEDIVSTKNDKFDIIYGNVEFRQPSGLGIVYKFPEKLTLDYFLTESIPHPSTLIRRSLFFDHGNYNESLKIVADWAFFFKVIIMESVPYLYIDRNISVFITDGISSNEKNESSIKEERASVIKKSFSSAVLEFIEEKKFYQRYYHQTESRKHHSNLNKLRVLVKKIIKK